MLIVDDTLSTYILESVHVPTSSTHFWVLDLQLLDFTLAPLEILEEIVCPALTIEINGLAFNLPTHWNVLIMDEETSQLDVVSIDELSGRPFRVFVYDNDRSFGYSEAVRVIDYSSEVHHVNPSLNRHHMLCHPFAPNKWICVAPNDGYNKYLKNLVMGDIL